TVDMQSATIVARHFYWQEVAYAKGLPLNTIMPLLDSIVTENGDTLLYVFNVPANQGFVVVSGQDNVIPVLAYGSNGQMEMSNLNPGASLLIGEYIAQIKHAAQQTALPSKEIQQAWSDLINGNAMPSQSKAIIGPMLTTTWGQGCNYNYSCPSMTGGPCGHALVGCAAVAMGQIVKFWNFPPRGSGSHSYTHSSLGTISATFNLAYDWANMPNSLTSSSTHADELLFHCGVTLNMNYGIGESSAFSEDVPGALIDHFYYKTTASHKYRSNYTTTSWRNLMIAEINAGRPALYAGHLSGGGGHGWVMDGYNNNTSTIYFHMNWGWGGSEDGWYTVDNLAPGPYNFSVDHKLVIGIEPKQTNLTFLSGSSNMSFNNDNLSISCTVQNNGAASSKSVELGYYIISGSTSRLFDTDAIPVLAPSFTSSQSAFKSIYSSDNAIPPGSHMVGIFVDHLGQENNESNEGDNMLVFPNAITTNCFPPSNVNASDGTYADRVYISWSPVVGANYYKVYRNTTNSTSGAVALTGWQMSTFYQNLSALPGITYYYFVQASTSTSGAYLSPFSSGDAGYVQITNLSDDVSQSVTTDPQYYQVLNSSIYWYAVGVRPNVSTEDWDIYMYSDATMTTSLA
ncbi:MAG TPA: C10 family peptidase, partial [Bacteroidales bacterium]|nr:C10 family peptidase [Bacteroidales bacterium]